MLGRYGGAKTRDGLRRIDVLRRTKVIQKMKQCASRDESARVNQRVEKVHEARYFNAAMASSALFERDSRVVRVDARPSGESWSFFLLDLPRMDVTV